MGDWALLRLRQRYPTSHHMQQLAKLLQHTYVAGPQDFGRCRLWLEQPKILTVVWEFLCLGHLVVAAVTIVLAAVFELVVAVVVPLVVLLRLEQALARAVVIVVAAAVVAVVDDVVVVARQGQGRCCCGS